jgi:hypothetical protein
MADARPPDSLSLKCGRLTGRGSLGATPPMEFGISARSTNKKPNSTSPKLGIYCEGGFDEHETSTHPESRSG